MGKSVKFKDDTYIDSTSIVYGTTRLDKKLEATDNAVVNAQNTASWGVNLIGQQIDNKSHAYRGYQKFTGDLMIQWGSTAVQIAAGVHEQKINIAYPVAFTSVFQVIACLSDVGYGVQGLDGGLGVLDFNTTSFNANYKDAGRYANTRETEIRWIAIGKA